LDSGFGFNRHRVIAEFFGGVPSEVGAAGAAGDGADSSAAAIVSSEALITETAAIAPLCLRRTVGRWPPHGRAAIA